VFLALLPILRNQGGKIDTRDNKTFFLWTTQYCHCPAPLTISPTAESYTLREMYGQDPQTASHCSVSGGMALFSISSQDDPVPSGLKLGPQLVMFCFFLTRTAGGFQSFIQFTSWRGVDAVSGSEEEVSARIHASVN
jgi:hypothetical protein